MSEPIWCNVWIKVPPSWGPEPPWFVGLASDALINGEPATLNRIIERTPEGEVRWVERPGEWSVNGFGNYGLADSGLEVALGVCERLGVPYIASDDPGPEWSGSWVEFDGFRKRTAVYDGNQTLLDHQTYKTIVAGESDFDSVDEFFTFARRGIDETLDSFKLGHLPTECPSPEEE